MNVYYLTDESEKSLAPFFSKRILKAVMAGVTIVAAMLVISWPRRPFSEIIAAADEPVTFFLVYSAALIVNSYISLCCGGGDMIRKGYHIISYQPDKPTWEKEIDFYRYGLVQFVLHTLLLYLPFMPLLAATAFSMAVPGSAVFMAAGVLYTTSLTCRLIGFLIYLWRGRASTLGYFAARLLMILFVFATIFPLPVLNPLRILYRLHHHPTDSGYPFAIFMAVVSFVIFVLILWSSLLVRRYMQKEGLEV